MKGIGLLICVVLGAVVGSAQQRETYADLPGVKLWFKDSGGNGVPVVFLHSNTGSSQNWQNQIAAFTGAGFRFIAYDRRGWGRSRAEPGALPGTAADDLHNLMKYLDIERFHLVGTAGGGFVVYDYALSFPEQLRSLVVANSIGGMQDEDYLFIFSVLLCVSVVTSALRQGYAVYIADQPGRGRAAYQASVYGALAPPDIQNVQRRFIAPERYNQWPQAHLHTQWPGSGAPGDPVFDQFYASQLPSIPAANATIFNRDAIVALLDKIGPAVVMTHSQSGAFGWPVADMRPDLVKAVIALEPSGPPFFDIENIGAPNWFRDAPTSYRVWGPTAAPLTYSPPAASPSDIAVVRQEKADAPDLIPCWLQKPPARQLPNLQKMPIMIMTAEASFTRPTITAP